MEKFLIATDLDGTILPTGGQIDPRDVDTLARLRRMGHVTAIATGRLHHAVERVIPPGFPVDYIIYSMGNGVLSRTGRAGGYSHLLTKSDVSVIAACTEQFGVGCMIHLGPGQSQQFYYNRRGRELSDFDARIRNHFFEATPFSHHAEVPENAAQALIIVESEGHYSAIKRFIEERAPLQVNRSTSPIDGESIWVEIFSSGVDKSLGMKWIMEREGIAREHTAAVGNDYNDIAMLEFAARPFVVAGAPQSLTGRFPVVADVHSAGFSEAMRDLFGDIL